MYVSTVYLHTHARALFHSIEALLLTEICRCAEQNRKRKRKRTKSLSFDCDVRYLLDKSCELRALVHFVTSTHS